MTELQNIVSTLPWLKTATARSGILLRCIRVASVAQFRGAPDADPAERSMTLHAAATSRIMIHSEGALRTVSTKLLLVLACRTWGK